MSKWRQLLQSFEEDWARLKIVIEGIVVAIDHSDATYEETEGAFKSYKQ
ncbi:hypothetical protein [Metabacillus niabensis]|nr:hypothetical protein [Metabacillus niabensis]